MNFDKLKDFMDRLTKWKIPGNSISVCIENKEVFSYQSGYSDVENKTPMTSDKLFNIYSCSKVATVTAGLQLYERGYFLLDDPLYDFLPEYKNMYIKDEKGNVTKATSSITMRHLFTMTSGMDYNRENEAIELARKITDGRMNTLTVAKCLAQKPLSFEPGSEWMYGMSHDVLAAVIEVISGKKFREYVKENIFEPLEMNESFYHNEAVQDRIAELYRYQNDAETDLVALQFADNSRDDGILVHEKKDVAPVFGSEYDSGGAGITTSVADYSKFVSALANGGIGQNGEQIISGNTIDLLRTNQLSDKQTEGFSWKQLAGYGYGLGVRTLTDRAKGGSIGNVGEFGWGGAAGATVLVDPKLKLSMFYTHHMLNPQEEYYQPRLRNVLYACL